MAIYSNKIKSAIMEFPNGTKIDVAKYINLPIAWEDTLDETLGTAKIIMTDMRQLDFAPYGVLIDKPFSVNTPIEIEFVGQSTKIRMIVARDTAEMVRKDIFATWSHNVEFVAEVKRLEQEPVDNLAFKNPIARSYDYNADAKWSYSQEDNNCWVADNILQVQKEKKVILAFNQSNFFPLEKPDGPTTLYFAINALKAEVVTPAGKVVVFNAPLIIEGEKYKNTNFEISLDEYGEYAITFELKWKKRRESADAVYDYDYTSTASTYFALVQENKHFSNYSIQSIIQRVLDLTPTRTKNGVNKYTFANNAEEYANEESPEFTFTNKHLFEVMLDIANYKRAFPALHKNEISFRPFWNGKILTSENLPPPYKAIINSAVDQYCTALDSYVENMVCVNDTNVGTVVEPYVGGYISARAGSGSAITEDKAVIPTLSTIYQPLAVNVNAKGANVGDIISYIYEKEDYEAFSDTKTAYPYSKTYALRYDRFAQNITELGHRITSKDSIADALRHPSFANIVYAVGGVEVGQELGDWLYSFVGTSNSAPFAECLFNTSYIPVINARVRQYKPLITEDSNATLFYNQQAEVVDSEAFGEHIKNMVQKLGNHTEIRVYRFGTIDEVPSCGTILDGKSVYNVSTTIYENHVDATLCLVEYAELSNYIGVKNEIKTSDISISKWNNRYINWEEFFVFTHENINGNALSITGNALSQVVNFTNADSGRTTNALTCAMFSTYTENGTEIVTAFAPVKHLAIGNSIYFQFEMLDNFAVGYKSNTAPSGATSAITGTRFDRAQTAVRYCDMLGRCETIDIMLLPTGPSAENNLWGEAENLNAEIKEIAHDYPLANEKYKPSLVHSVIDARPVFALKEQNALLVKKNSAEALKFALQYHYRQTWKDFIVGSGMSNFCALVGGKSNGVQFFVSNEPINRYERRINILDTNKYFVTLANPTFTVDEPKGRIVIKLPSAINGYMANNAPVVSWGFVGEDKNGGYQLIFGENRNGNMPFKDTIYLVGMAKNNT